jgi:hypothetical protein
MNFVDNLSTNPNTKVIILRLLIDGFRLLKLVQTVVKKRTNSSYPNAFTSAKLAGMKLTEI